MAAAEGAYEFDIEREGACFEFGHGATGSDQRILCRQDLKVIGEPSAIAVLYDLKG